MDIEQYDVLNSLGLLITDAQCYRAICMKLIETSKEDRPALLGVGNGSSAFLSTFFSQDISTVVYEGTNLLCRYGSNENELFADSMPGYFERLKSVRNSIHLYNKSGPYRPKATKIVNNQLKEFNMLEMDPFIDLRNDISVIFDLSKTGKRLLGTNYSVFHILEDKFGWSGEEVRNYSKNTASFLNTFSCLDLFVLPSPDNTVLINKSMQIELFDYKSKELFKRTSLDNTTTFRLLLMLSSVSYIECLFEMYIDLDITLKSDLWLCFLNKFVAIKYDEVFDSLENLLAHIKEEEKNVLGPLFQTGCINIGNFKYRDVARKLRNMIHYSSNNYVISFAGNSKPEINVCQVYARRSGLTSWDEMGDNLTGMLEDLSSFGNILREIISLNDVCE